MTPMPPEIPNTLAAHQMIIEKVKAALACNKVRISPFEALTLALLPLERITVNRAIAKRFVVGANGFHTVKRLSSCGFIACIDQNGKPGGKRGGRVAIELTRKGFELAEAIRKALGGEEAVRMEAAE